MMDRPWIVVVKGKKGWTVTMGFYDGIQACECQRVLLESGKYEDAIVAFNPAYKIP